MNTDILVLFLTLGGKLSVFHHLIRCEFFINTLYHVEELAFYFYLSECFYHKKVLCECCHFSRVQVFVTPWTIARQAPLSSRLSRQEYWSWFPILPLGDLFKPGIKPASPALQADSLPLSHRGRPYIFSITYKSTIQTGLEGVCSRASSYILEKEQEWI